MFIILYTVLFLTVAFLCRIKNCFILHVFPRLQPKFASFAEDFKNHIDGYQRMFDSVDPHR